MTVDWRKAAPVVLAGLLLSLVAFSVAGYLHFDDRVLLYQLIDDPAPFVGLPWYTGSLSYFGVLLWCASASACAMAGALLLESAALHRRQLSRLLLLLAGVNLWFCLDDLLLIHEELAEKFFGWESRHKGEALIFAVYAVLAVVFFWRFRAIFAQTEMLLLAVAVVCFAASIAIDVVLTLDMGGNNIFLDTVLSVSWGGPIIDLTEEILKLNGVLIWFVYLFRAGFFAVRDELRTIQLSTAQSPAARPQSTKRRKAARR